MDWYHKSETEREPSGTFKEHWLVTDIAEIQFKVLFK